MRTPPTRSFLSLLVLFMASMLPCVISAQPEEGAFWAGVTRDTMVERKLADGWKYFRQASLLARNRYAFRAPHVVLLRDGQAYVLNTGKLRGVMEGLPIKSGDKFFEFISMDDLASLKVPVFEMEKAIEELLKQPENDKK